MENNIVNISGIVIEEPKISHNFLEETFYSFLISVPRMSNIEDIIQVIISEKLMNIKKIKNSKFVYINGQFRSYNIITCEKKKLILSTFAKSIFGLDYKPDFQNEVKLRGFICKNVIYRKTPLGREIADIIIAVNRNHNKSDYIPCIAWGENAKRAAELQIGSEIIIEGRLQSRKYMKCIDNNCEERLAFEVSISKLIEINKN